MKPADFFVGAMDFFAILLPGAILAYLLSPWERLLFGAVLPALDGATPRWVAFAIGAYVFGHLLHAAGSMLDGMYDRNYVKPLRARKGDVLFHRAKTAMGDEFKAGGALEQTNKYEYALCYVQTHNAAAASELERISADSKFFRSMCLLAALAATLAAMQTDLLAAAFWLTLMVFSYRRFCSLRWKATQQVYRCFIMLKEEVPKPANRSPAVPAVFVSTAPRRGWLPRWIRRQPAGDP